MDAQEHKPESNRIIRIVYALAVLAAAAALGYFVYTNATSPDARFPFKLGLDLAGGSQLIYEADTEGVVPEEVPALMGVLRDVIERRVNIFGVSEPLVQVSESSIVASEAKQRLVVELPGVTDIDTAVAEIGRTPLLEFKLIDEEALAAQQAAEAFASSTPGAVVSNVRVNGSDGAEPYIDTGLTGRYLERAQLEFIGQTGQGGLANEPVVTVHFTEEGAALFEEITTTHVGRTLAIFLDGELISAPRINEAIAGGTAVISGGFTPDEARALAENLSFGALPVPIELVHTQTIGASLGSEALAAGVKAGAIGFAILSIFMVLWYRLPGLIAVIALVTYTIIMLALFQFIPVVLTAAGIAGFILSVGLAVDANVLIAERIKEELREGKGAEEAIREGFGRAWLAIRDANLTSILAAAILFWFGTSLVKGFALVLGIGILVSMFSAITVSRTLLAAIPIDVKRPIGRFLMSSGFTR